jgi:signal transduction histidine kinase
MFYRATDDGAGSGLGLYIVKETIDKLQGAIHIESVEGKGTTVRLEIPELP